MTPLHGNIKFIAYNVFLKFSTPDRSDVVLYSALDSADRLLNALLFGSPNKSSTS